MSVTGQKVQRECLVDGIGVGDIGISRSERAVRFYRNGIIRLSCDDFKTSGKFLADHKNYFTRIRIYEQSEELVFRSTKRLPANVVEESGK